MDPSAVTRFVPLFILLVFAAMVVILTLSAVRALRGGTRTRRFTDGSSAGAAGITTWSTDSTAANFDSGGSSSFDGGSSFGGGGGSFGGSDSGSSSSTS